jgi:hypothetical protein
VCRYSRSQNTRRDCGRLLCDCVLCVRVCVMCVAHLRAGMTSLVPRRHARVCALMRLTAQCGAAVQPAMRAVQLSKWAHCICSLLLWCALPRARARVALSRWPRTLARESAIACCCWAWLAAACCREQCSHLQSAVLPVFGWVSCVRGGARHAHARPMVTQAGAGSGAALATSAPSRWLCQVHSAVVAWWRAGDEGLVKNA